jgi:hypothetical protein
VWTSGTILLSDRQADWGQSMNQRELTSLLGTCLSRPPEISRDLHGLHPLISHKNKLSFEVATDEIALSPNGRNCISQSLSISPM